MKTVNVNCPYCNGVLEIDTSTGKIIEKWPSVEEQQLSGDKISNALKKIEDSKKKRASLFEQTKGQIDESKKKRENLFKEGVEKIKNEGLGEKPTTPFDLD